jgi:hypothetical protein
MMLLKLKINAKHTKDILRVLLKKHFLREVKPGLGCNAFNILVILQIKMSFQGNGV